MASSGTAVVATVVASATTVVATTRLTFLKFSNFVGKLVILLFRSINLGLNLRVSIGYHCGMTLAICMIAPAGVLHKDFCLFILFFLQLLDFFRVVLGSGR